MSGMRVQQEVRPVRFALSQVKRANELDTVASTVLVRPVRLTLNLYLDRCASHRNPTHVPASPAPATPAAARRVDGDVGFVPQL